MNSDQDPDMIDAYTALFLWIESATVRLAAMESIIKTHLNLTEEQWAAALQKANAEFPPATENREGFAVLADFLKRATKH